MKFSNFAFALGCIALLGVFADAEDLKCKACKLSTHVALDFLNAESVQEDIVNFLMTDYCSLLQDKKQSDCKKQMQFIKDGLSSVLSSVDSEDMCEMLHACKNKDASKYVIEILENSRNGPKCWICKEAADLILGLIKNQENWTTEKIDSACSFIGSQFGRVFCKHAIDHFVNDSFTLFAEKINSHSLCQHIKWC